MVVSALLKLPPLSGLAIIQNMKLIKIIGLIVLAAVWLWLCRLIILSGGITLRTIFLIVASGIIIFVPLWRKYFNGETNDNKR